MELRKVSLSATSIATSVSIVGATISPGKFPGGDNRTRLWPHVTVDRASDRANGAWSWRVNSAGCSLDGRAMANQETLSRISEILDDYAKVDMDKVKRSGLGDESLSPDIAGLEKEINLIARQADNYADRVHDSVALTIIPNLRKITAALDEQAKRSPNEYIDSKQSFIESLQTQIEQSKLWRSEIAQMLMLNLEVFEVESLQDDVREIKDHLESTKDSFLPEIQNQCTHLLNEAKKSALEIEERARQTARKISVQDAQEQFQAAVDKGTASAQRWSWIVTVSLGALIGTILLLMFCAEPPKGKEVFSAESLYFTLTRLFLLSTLASGSAFAFKMLRVHLHMTEKNRHRVRVANSVEGFVQSAGDPAQRDLILAKMTDAIVNFGDSGLVQHDREESTPTTSNDLVGRVVAALSGKN